MSSFTINTPLIPESLLLRELAVLLEFCPLDSELPELPGLWGASSATISIRMCTLSVILTTVITKSLSPVHQVALCVPLLYTPGLQEKRSLVPGKNAHSVFHCYGENTN